MEFTEVVRRRRMVRAFERRALPRGTAERVLEAAHRAPSAGFSQGFEFLVFDGFEETAAFWDVGFPVEQRDGFGWPLLFDAPLVIVPLAHKDAYLDRYAEADKGWTDRDEARWPVPYWYVDTGMAALLALLSAVDQGLGALFFGFHSENVDALRAHFDVPAAYAPIGAIAIGYPAPDRPSPSLQRGRRPLPEIVHRGRW
jgi:nitroreductase